MTTLNQVEFSDSDHKTAEKIAKRKGYTQTVYTSTSALIALFCLGDNVSHRPGAIIKTRELGFLFVQDLEGMGFYDLHEREVASLEGGKSS